MIYLSGGHLPDVYHPRLGLMAQPGSYSGAEVFEHYADRVWAADNGCFSERLPFSESKWRRWLERVAPHAGTCLFAVLPDVYGSAWGTLMRAVGLADEVRALGFKTAFVCQPGFYETVDEVPWPLVDALFVGGPNEWKHSEPAWRLPQLAGERGLWCHMGRVNSMKRIAACRSAGFDSADGTILALNPSAWPKVRGWLDDPRERLMI